MRRRSGSQFGVGGFVALPALVGGVDRVDERGVDGGCGFDGVGIGLLVAVSHLDDGEGLQFLHLEGQIVVVVVCQYFVVLVDIGAVSFPSSHILLASQPVLI